MESDDWEDEDDFIDSKISGAAQFDPPVTQVEPVVWSITPEDYEDFRSRFIFLARGESHLTPEFVKETFDAVLPGPDLFEIWYVCKQYSSVAHSEATLRHGRRRPAE
jgi:hypothetical protein